jgi:hypothetical protein
VPTRFNLSAANLLHEKVLSFLPTKDCSRVVLYLCGCCSRCVHKNLTKSSDINQQTFADSIAKRGQIPLATCYQFLSGFKQAWPLWNIVDAEDDAAEVAQKGACAPFAAPRS